MNDPLSRGTSLPEPHRGVADKAKETAKDLGSQVKEKVQDWASSAASTAESAWESTKSGATAVADKAKEWGGDVSDFARNPWDDLNGFVRRNPMPSLLIAFGLGWCM